MNVDFNSGIRAIDWYINLLLFNTRGMQQNYQRGASDYLAKPPLNYCACPICIQSVSKVRTNAFTVHHHATNSCTGHYMRGWPQECTSRESQDCPRTSLSSDDACELLFCRPTNGRGMVFMRGALGQDPGEIGEAVLDIEVEQSLCA